VGRVQRKLLILISLSAMSTKLEVETDEFFFFLVANNSMETNT
jgi:hypothetical protein